MPAGPRPQPPSRCVKLTYSGTYYDAIWNNVMWLFLTGSGEISVSELNALASQCSLKYSARFLPLLSNQLQLSSTQVVLYSAGDSFEGVAGVGGSGSVASGAGIPANSAVAISWVIAPVYRGGHARTYLCGVTTQMLLNSTTLAGASVTALNSAANAFHTDLEAISGISAGISSIEHGIVSFVRDKQWRSPPVFYRIASGHVDTRLDSQRRRLGPDRV